MTQSALVCIFYYWIIRVILFFYNTLYLHTTAFNSSSLLIFFNKNFHIIKNIYVNLFVVFEERKKLHR